MSPELRATLESWLCSDDPIARAHAVWRLAQPDTLPDQPTIPLPEALAALAIVRRCPYRSTAGCGCTGARCALRGLTPHAPRPTPHVSHRDCLDCARRYGP